MKRAAILSIPILILISVMGCAKPKYNYSALETSVNQPPAGEVNTSYIGDTMFRPGMTGDHKPELGKAISGIETIAIMLPSVGKRSELKVMQQEMYKLITEARKHADALEKELISLQYEYPSDRFKRVKGVKRG